MDLSGTERLHHAAPAVSLARLARRIEAEIGITVSIGLSFNKFLAKIASDLEKPRGFSVIGRAEAISFLAEKPVSLIWGVGKATQARLAADGIRTALKGVVAVTLVTNPSRERGMFSSIQAGARAFVSFHLLVPGAWSVQHGHDWSERIEADIRRAVAHAHITTHLEPMEDPLSLADQDLDRGME